VARERTDRVTLYIERFLDNSYARESLDNAVSALREAYRRGLRKGSSAPADRKFRDRVTDAVVAMRETADAVQTGRKRPKGRLAKRALMAAAAGAVAAGAIIASSDEVRAFVFGRSGKTDQTP
jgi:hypothetical protein